MPNDSLTKRKKNVVVIIIESFGREYIGGFNKWLDGGRYKGYTPFVDSLMQHSATYQYSFCNGRKSIDGMPSVLSSIPMFIEPFFLTSASMNNVSGLAGELKEEGYYSAFFHGAENGSMGFQAFARARVLTIISDARSLMPTSVLAVTRTSMELGRYGMSLSCSFMPPRWAR